MKLALKEALHSLPDFCYRDISIDWAVNSPGNEISIVMEDKIREECRSVRGAVVKLLSKYETPE